MSDIFKIDNTKIIRNDITTVGISPNKFFNANSGHNINNTGLINLNHMQGQTKFSSAGGGGSLSSSFVVPIESGGTGATNFGDAQQNLNLVPGTDIQIHSTALDSVDSTIANTFSDTIYYVDAFHQPTPLIIGDGLKFSSGTLTPNCLGEIITSVTGTNYDLQVDECPGIFTKAGGPLINFTLYDIANAKTGPYSFEVYSAPIKISSNDIIRFSNLSTTGGYIISSGFGSFITLVSNNLDTWQVTSLIGNWSIV